MEQKENEGRESRRSQSDSTIAADSNVQDYAPKRQHKPTQNVSEASNSTEDKEKHSDSEEQDFLSQEKKEKKHGKPSQQPISQEAHVDPGYYTLNPWYGQPYERGQMFSTAWPFPRTVRPGMLNNLDLASARGQDEQQDHESNSNDGEDAHEQPPPGTPDLERGQLDYIAARLSRENAQHGGRSGEGSPSMPPDIRGEEHRPVPHAQSKEDTSQEDEVPQDIRREDMRPTTGVPPRERTNKQRHHLTHRGTGRTASTVSNKDEETMSHLRHQASTKGDDSQAHQDPHEKDELRNRWARLRARAPEPLAEFVATTVSIYIGLAGSLSKTTSENTYGDFHTQSLSWGFGVMFGIYIAGGVSGAHLNPAISITLSLFRGFSWRRCGIYIIAQLLGGLVAGVLAFCVYKDSLYHFDPTLSPSKSGIAFFTLPQPWISVTSAFFNEYVAGVVIMIVLLALGDDTNAPPGAGMNAFILGLLVTSLVWTSSYQTGLALNPARDFGPRLVALWMGYPSSIFTGYNWWWLWGAWVAPIIGCITGCTVYDTMVFSGGESPLNYRWPTKKDLVRQIRGRKGHAKGDDEEEGDKKEKRERRRRVHDHVYAHAKT